MFRHRLPSDLKNTLLNELKTEQLLTPEIAALIDKQSPKYIEDIIELQGMLKSLDEPGIVEFYTSDCVLAACEHAEYSDNINTALNFLWNANLLTPNNFIKTCQFATQTEGYISAYAFALFFQQENNNVNLLTQSNFDQLPKLFKHCAATVAALRSLLVNSKLTQALLDRIFADPSHALYIARAHEGGVDFRDGEVIDAFDEIQKNGLVLSQAIRTQTIFFSRMPMEVIFKITRHSIEKDTLDDQTVLTSTVGAIENNLEKPKI